MENKKFKIVQINDNEFVVEIHLIGKKEKGFLWWKKEFEYKYYKHALDFRKVDGSGYYDAIIFNSIEEAENAIKNNFEEYNRKYPLIVKEINL